MSGLIAAVVLAVLASAAVAGAVYPYRRGAVPAMEPLADPLEDRRRSLLISLRDLESAREQGAVEPAEYERLRADTEARMARVLRALDRRAEGDGHAASARRGRGPSARWVAVAVGAILSLSVAVVPGLMRSLSQRDDGVDLASVNSLQFFQQRVADNPHDVAARLDLADRYLDAGRFEGAHQQYLVAVELDADNAEALANLGILEHLLNGSSAIGLDLVERALEADPAYAEALFFKGSILLKGMGRPEEAVVALRAYLEAAPYGSEAPTAKNFIEEAQREMRDH